MKSSSRFLLGFGITIGVLVTSAIVLVLTANNSVSLLPPDTPEGTVQRILIALQDNDIQKAFGYISSDSTVTSYPQWFRDTYLQSAWKAEILKTSVQADGTAQVVVKMDTLQTGNSVISPIYDQQVYFNLKNTDGSWVIIYPYFKYPRS